MGGTEEGMQRRKGDDLKKAGKKERQGADAEESRQDALKGLRGGPRSGKRKILTRRKKRKGAEV